MDKADVITTLKFTWKMMCMENQNMIPVKKSLDSAQKSLRFNIDTLLFLTATEIYYSIEDNPRFYYY